MKELESMPGTDNSSGVHVEQLTKRYRQGSAEVTALAGVDMHFAKREFVAVMGASGSGKTTLLHLLAGLTTPSSGRVVVDGEELSLLSDYRLTLFRRQHIGIVFQSFNLIPSLTALQNVTLPLQAAGEKFDHQRIDSLLEQLGIVERRHHRPSALSGGEQQRVAIARALVSDPSILLADEPTGNLDSANGQKLCQLLRDLHERDGRSIMLVTHEPSVAIWADRVVVLQDGLISAQFPTVDFDSAQSLAAHYQELTSPATRGATHVAG